MADVTITIRGLEELLRKIKRMDGDVKPMLIRATEKAVKYVHGTVPEYPAPRPGQRYVRTGTLGRSITTEVKPLGSEIVGKIGTNTVYAPWVISEESAGGRGPQAWMHKDRWWTLQGVVRKARGAVVRIFQKEIRGWFK